MIASTSPIIRTAVQATSPLALVIGIYLLFAGHNNPGGGFASGLVFGAAIALRTMANLPRPASAVSLLAGGIVVVVATAAFPLLGGNSLLDQSVFSIDVPVLGPIKSGSALPFDIGVTAIVVGLVIALLDGFDAEELAPELVQK